MKLPKHLRDFAQKHNFTWDAKANLLYGSWQGYYFTIAQHPSGRPTHIIITVCRANRWTARPRLCPASWGICSPIINT